MEYDLIQKYTVLPSFPYFRSHLLYCFLSRSAYDLYDQLYPLVTSLVQLGLNIHDTIDAHLFPTEDVHRMRARQLSVLAGDYFSSHFYELLSRHERIDVVGQLSMAVCEINVLKMDMYQRIQHHCLSSEQYLQDRVQLNTQLFLSFSTWIEDGERALFEQLLTYCTQLDTIQEEIGLIHAGQVQRNSYIYWYIKERNEQLPTQHLFTAVKSDVLQLLAQKLYNCISTANPSFQQCTGGEVLTDALCKLKCNIDSEYTCKSV